MAYIGIIECGWATGVHDVRGIKYKHPWLVVHRPSGTVEGCWTKKEAQSRLRELKANGAEDPRTDFQDDENQI